MQGRGEAPLRNLNAEALGTGSLPSEAGGALQGTGLVTRVSGLSSPSGQSKTLSRFHRSRHPPGQPRGREEAPPPRYACAQPASRATNAPPAHVGPRHTHAHSRTRARAPPAAGLSGRGPAP